MFIRVNLWFRVLPQFSGFARRGLAAGAKVAAPARDDHAADDCFASKTRLSVALVDAVAELEIAALAFGIDVVRNGRAARTDGFLQYAADCAMQRQKLLRRKVFRDAGRVQAGSEQAFIRVDVAYPPQNFLIEQQRLDSSAPRPKALAKFIRADFQWLFSERPRKFRQSRFRQKKHAAKTSNIRVTQLVAIVENKKNMRVGRNGIGGMNYSQLSRHSQVNDEVA